MEHAFDVNVAKQYSVNIALFLQHMRFWTFNNLINKRNIHDGLCWTYNSLEALLKTFSYWSKQNLETVIKHCSEQGLIKKGNYNSSKYDRTTWYALTPFAYQFFDELLDETFIESLCGSISENQDLDEVEFRNLFTRTKTPIPDTNPDTKPIIKTPISPLEKQKKEKVISLTIEQMLNDNKNMIPEEFIREWHIYRKKPITPRVWNKTNSVLSELMYSHGMQPMRAFERMLEKQWQGIEVSYFMDEISKPITSVALKSNKTVIYNDTDTSWVDEVQL